MIRIPCTPLVRTPPRCRATASALDDAVTGAALIAALPISAKENMPEPVAGLTSVAAYLQSSHLHDVLGPTLLSAVRSPA